MLEEQVFNAKLHDRAGFRCGEPALDDYLQRFAAQQSERGVSTVYLLVNDAQPSATDRKKLPPYPVPCFRMGRLACRPASP